MNGNTIQAPLLDALKKALHREASQVGFLAIEDVDRVFASVAVAKPVAWYWEDATGCFHMTVDRPDVEAMAAVVGCEPKPLYPAPGETSRFFDCPAPGFCPMCQKAFKLGDVLRPRPNAPGPVHAVCLESKPDIDRETGGTIIEILPTFLYGEPAPVPAFSLLKSPKPETCPTCREPFKLSDVCATDITEGACHAECLEGSPVVDLASGEETGGEVDTFHYVAIAAPAPLPQVFIPTHRHLKRGSTYQLIGGATVQTNSPLSDMDDVVIYRNEDGSLWARSTIEFFDGRFEELAQQKSGAV